MSVDQTTPLQHEVVPAKTTGVLPAEETLKQEQRTHAVPDGPGGTDAFVAELVAIALQEPDGAGMGLEQHIRHLLTVEPLFASAFTEGELTLPLSTEDRRVVAWMLIKFILAHGIESYESKFPIALVNVAYFVSGKSLETCALMLWKSLRVLGLVPSQVMVNPGAPMVELVFQDDLVPALIRRITETEASRIAEFATSEAPAELLLSIVAAFSIKWRRGSEIDPFRWSAQDRVRVLTLCQVLNEADAQEVRRAVSWIDDRNDLAGPTGGAGAEATNRPTLVVCSQPFASEADRESKELLVSCGSLRGPLPLASMPAVERLQEAQNELAQEFPWAVDVVAQVFDELCAKAILGCDVLHLEPTLFVGPPGSGKSRLMRRLGEVLRVPTIDLPLGGSADVKVISGTSRGWGSGRPNDVVMAMVANASATVAANLDELDKAGGDVRHGQLHSYLLSLLEPETCRRFRDSFLKTECDMSGVIWLATANQLSPLPAPLLLRLRVLMVTQPKPEHFRAIAKGVLRDLAVRWRVPHWTLPRIDDLDLPLEKLTSAREVRRGVEAAVTRVTLASRRSRVPQ